MGRVNSPDLPSKKLTLKHGISVDVDISVADVAFTAIR